MSYIKSVNLKLETAIIQHVVISENAEVLDATIDKNGINIWYVHDNRKKPIDVFLVLYRAEQKTYEMEQLIFLKSFQLKANEKPFFLFQCKDALANLPFPGE